MLNVSFLVPQMRREFGGCAGNIAYNLKLLGDVGLPMATVGNDFAPYREWMQRAGRVRRAHQASSSRELTAQAFITTDLDDNQITAFHPGAMQHCAPEPRRSEARGVALGIVAPGRTPGHDRACGAVRGRQDPLHLRPRPGAADVLRRGPEDASSRRPAGWRSTTTSGSCCSRRPAGTSLDVTGAGRGLDRHARRGRLEHLCSRQRDPTIPCAAPERSRRSHGLRRCLSRRSDPRPAAGLDWETTGHVASLMGAIKIESRGHAESPLHAAEFAARLAAFAEAAARPCGWVKIAFLAQPL